MPEKRNPPEKREANLTFQEMEVAIIKIDRRLSDLRSFDVETVSDRSDPRISALSSKLDTLLSNTFGNDTVEYDRYQWQVTILDTASENYYYETPIEEIRAGLAKGIQSATSQLEAIKEGFQEELEDAGQGTSAKPLKAYEGLDLHPHIEKAAGTLFRNGHFANAIEDAVKALNALVRLNSGVDDKDGTSLMESVFNPKTPILKVNDLADKSDADEQKGMMMMFSGAVAGLRNPRAHKLIEDDPEKTLEFIAFVSLLAKIADAAKRA